MACYLHFFVFSFILAGLFISRCPLWRSGWANVSSTMWFLAGFFFTFLFDFGSQIYTSLPTSDWHAPPSHVPRRLPPLPPQAPVVLVIGDRRMAPTRLGALYSMVCVRATLGLFQAVLGGNRLYGGGSPSGWTQWRRVFLTRRRLASWHFPPLPAACFGCFLPMCFLCFSLVSLVSACLCLDQILWEYLLANC
jgi:hypothetical protein